MRYTGGSGYTADNYHRERIFSLGAIVAMSGFGLMLATQYWRLAHGWHIAGMLLLFAGTVGPLVLAE